MICIVIAGRQNQRAYSIDPPQTPHIPISRGLSRKRAHYNHTWSSLLHIRLAAGYGSRARRSSYLCYMLTTRERALAVAYTRGACDALDVLVAPIAGCFINHHLEETLHFGVYGKYMADARGE